MFNFNDLVFIILRSIFTFIFMYLVMILLGKKQMRQFTIFDYIFGITIGSLGADTILSLDKHFINGIIAIFIFTILAFVFSVLSLKLDFFHKIFIGNPLILMENGNFVYENLRRAKITVFKFLERARLNGFYDLSLINYAILETSGEISFLAKEEYQCLSIKDLRQSKSKNVIKQTMCFNLIVDGVIQKDTLNYINKDEIWLINKMKKLKVNEISQVALAIINQRGIIKVYRELL